VNRFVSVSVICAAAISLSLATPWVAPVSAADNDGCASPEAPSQVEDVYQIDSQADLMWVKGGINGSTTTQWGSSYKQTAEIDMSGCTWETAIGSNSTNFEGTYDGDGFAITNLTVSKASANYLGLFGDIGGTATVKNLALTNATVSGGSYIGLLAGSVNSGATIENISTSGSVTGSGGWVGGLIGESSGRVSSSSSTAQVAGVNLFVGGLIGITQGGTIQSTFATGDVSTGTPVSGLGGLIGEVGAGTTLVTDSYATGNVTTSGSGSYAGGLVGILRAGAITQSFASGDVDSGSSVDATGGLVGQAQANVSNSYATGSVSGSLNVGGLIGTAASMTLEDSYSTGAVSGVGAQVGGLLGKQSGTTASNSFWDTDTSNKEDSALEGAGQVTGETTANMKTLSTFSDATWDIGDGWQSGETWGICDGTTYPFLIWQYDESPCSLTTPTVDTAESTSSGFTFNVTNYDSDYDYSFSATSGSASAGTASGSDLPVTVTGVSGGASSTVTVTASRTGYASSDVSLTGRATGGGSSGGGGSPSTPAPTAEPTTSPTIPTIQVNPDSLLLNPDGGPLVVSAGRAAAYSGKGELPTPELIQDDSLWTAAGPGYALQVLGPQPLDVQQRSTTAATIPVITDGQTVAVAARGFATDATVRGWVVSRDSVPGAPPVVEFIADSTGSAIGAFQVEVHDPGPNTVQFRGLTPFGSVLTILLGLEVKPQTSVSRFAINFRTDRDTLTKRSQEQLANALGAGGISSTELNVTIRRLRADGSDGRALARERKRELRKELISLGIPRSNIDISIKSVKKPRFAKRSIVDVRHDR